MRKGRANSHRPASSRLTDFVTPVVPTRRNRIGPGGVVPGVSSTLDGRRTGSPMSIERGDGSEAEFLRLYETQYDTTVRLIRFLTGDHSAAEDLAQDSFVRVYRYLQRPRRPVDDPVALLRTTATNVCRSWHRSRTRAQLRLVRHGTGDESLTEWERELDASMHRLPYDQRAVVVLRHWLGLSEAEIATALGCRPGTVKSRHSRALRTLRKDLS